MFRFNKKAVNEKPELHRSDTGPATKASSDDTGFWIKSFLAAHSKPLRILSGNVCQVSTNGPMSIVRKELNKKRKILPLRQPINRHRRSYSRNQASFYDEPYVDRHLSPAWKN